MDSGDNVMASMIMGDYPLLASLTLHGKHDYGRISVACQ